MYIVDLLSSKKIKIVFLLFAALVAVLTGSSRYVSARQVKPSFDCRKATTAVEKLICTNDYWGQSLAKMDFELAKEYKRILGKLNKSNKTVFVKGQRSWLESRKHDCHINRYNEYSSQNDAMCLWKLYGKRLSQFNDDLLHSIIKAKNLPVKADINNDGDAEILSYVKSKKSLLIKSSRKKGPVSTIKMAWPSEFTRLHLWGVFKEGYLLATEVHVEAVNKADDSGDEIQFYLLDKNNKLHQMGESVLVSSYIGGHISATSINSGYNEVDVLRKNGKVYIRIESFLSQQEQGDDIYSEEALKDWVRNTNVKYHEGWEIDGIDSRETNTKTRKIYIVDFDSNKLISL